MTRSMKLEVAGLALGLACLLSSGTPGQSFSGGLRAEREVSWAPTIEDAFAEAHETGKPVLMVMSVNFMGDPKLDKC